MYSAWNLKCAQRSMQEKDPLRTRLGHYFSNIKCSYAQECLLSWRGRRTGCAQRQGKYWLLWLDLQVLRHSDQSRSGTYSWEYFGTGRAELQTLNSAQNKARLQCSLRRKLRSQLWWRWSRCRPPPIFTETSQFQCWCRSLLIVSGKWAWWSRLSKSKQ